MHFAGRISNKSISFQFRVKAYIVYGSEDNALDASLSCSSKPGDKVAFPENGWEEICKAAVSLEFGMSQIVAYFVTRSVTDGKVAGDLKSINKSAQNLFVCGHIQNILCVEVKRIFLYQV